MLGVRAPWRAAVVVAGHSPTAARELPWSSFPMESLSAPDLIDRLSALSLGKEGKELPRQITVSEIRPTVYFTK